MSKGKATADGRELDIGRLALAFFDRVLPGPSWAVWRVLLLALFGLPMGVSEAATFQQCTGRLAPTKRAREAWLAIARRAGKTRFAAFLIALLAAVVRWKLAPGERGVVLCVSPSRRQSTVLLDYCEAFLQMLPGVEIVRRTLDSIELASGIVIQVQSASFRTPRGFTVVACVLDEIAFFHGDDGKNPDREILRGVRPSLASVPGSLLIALSSPYAKRGELYRMFEKHYGRDGDVLVWRAPTALMNPTIDEAVINQALADDPEAASSEWLAEFRADLQSLFTPEAIGACVVPGRHELPPLRPGAKYVGFVDPSGGSADSFTLAIAHRNEAGVAVLDLLRERQPPFSPESVVAEFARELKRFGVSIVVGDRCAGEWPREQFRKHGIEYQTGDYSTTGEMTGFTKSEIFIEALPMINSGACELLDNNRLVGQLTSLERRTGRSGGKDSVDHPPGGHDDLANSACGALVHAQMTTAHALPASFVQCYRAASIPSFNLTTCYLFHGPFKPTLDLCCKNCVGHAYVLAGVRAQQERTGSAIYFVEFYRTQVGPNEFVSRVLANKWADTMGI